MIPHGGDTALLFAARSGDLASATLLLTAGANVNDQDAWGVSAVVLAAHSGFDELVALLLARGADPNAPLATWTSTRRSSKDYYFAPELVGATPYWLAARFTAPEVMQLLLERGADARVVHHGHYHSEEPVCAKTALARHDRGDGRHRHGRGHGVGAAGWRRHRSSDDASAKALTARKARAMITRPSRISESSCASRACSMAARPWLCVRLASARISRA